jgi:autotransporter-associated beta strand protein
MSRPLPRRRARTQAQCHHRRQQDRRRFLIESLEARSLLATITGGTAIGGFEPLNSPALLYQLDAGSLAQTGGTPVAAWNNQGTAANHFTQANTDKQPTYLASGSLGNGLPTVSFDGTISGWSGTPAVAPLADELVLTNPTAPTSVFIVNSTSSTNGLDGIFGTNDGDFGIRRVNSGAWQHPGNGNDLSNPGVLAVNGVAATNPAAPLNTPHLLTATRPLGANLSGTSLGDYFQSGGVQPRAWGGEIGTILAFNRSVSTTERIVIENALAAKYGLTLAAGDIYAGDTPLLGNYDQGMIGIGGQASANVALGKPTTQSSLGAGLGDAEHAVDGNLDGNYNNRSVTHTASEVNPSWQVNLGTNFPITALDLWNRTDCCPERMRDIRVQILDASDNVVWQNATLLNPGNALGGPRRLTIDLKALTGGPILGHKVKVISEGAAQILSLSEVQVWSTSYQPNVAVGDPAVQSSTTNSGVASRANDGNTNGSFSGNSVTHTAQEANPFWQVDLGADTSIAQVLLYNRTDCCGDRLTDMQVEVLDSSLTPIFSQGGLNAANSLDSPYMFGLDLQTANGGTPITGRYVRITAVGASKTLSLAEVMVLTNPAQMGPEVASAGSHGFGLEQIGPAAPENFLTAGFQQSANALTTTDLPAGVDSRWERAWYVDKTGTLDARLAFDFSDAGLSAPPASTVGYQLLYSPNNNFEAASSSFVALNLTPTIAGDRVTFDLPSGVLSDGYYTLGLLDGNMTIQADSATANDGNADPWRLVRSGANLEVYQGATLVRSTPYASVTSIAIVGSNDNDTLTVDQAGGTIAKPISFTGGGQTGGPGDTLVISGGSASTINYSFVNNSDGSVSIDGNVITYTGLEPITDNMLAANRIFTFTGGAETIAVTDVGGADGVTRIDSSLGEFVDFTVPTASLTIITNGGDTATLSSFDSAFNTPLITLEGSGAVNTFNLGAANVLPNTSDLRLTGAVNFNLNGFSEQIGSLGTTNSAPLITLSAGQTLTTGNANPSTFTGQLAGSGNLTKVGSGIFTIAGAGTTDNAGTTGLLTVAGGTLILGGGFATDGAWKGNITVNNTATLQSAQASIIADSTDITIDAGGTWNMAGFTDIVGNLQGGGNVTGHTASLTLDDLSGTRTFTGNISGGSSLVVRGAVDATGTQVLAGTSYAFSSLVVGRGTLTFNNSPTVTVGGTFAVGDTTGAGVSSGAITAVANLNGGTFTIGHFEVGNRQSGTATVTATVNQPGAMVSVTGGTPPDGANLRVGHWPSVNAFYNLSGTGTLTANTALGSAVDGNGTFTQSGGTLNTGGIIVNLRNPGGTGTFNLNGGITNVGAGGISTAGTPGTNSFLNLGGGTIRATAAFNTSHPAVITATTTIDTNGNAVTWSGVLSGAGGLTKQGAGVLTLSGNNDFGGAVQINGGTLAVSDIADAGSSSNLGSGSTITLNGGTLGYTAASVDSSNRPIALGVGHGGIEVVAGGDITYSGNITGGNRFTKFGAGQLTFTSASASIGTLFVTGGTLVLAGSGTFTLPNILPGADTTDGAQVTGNGTLNITGSVVVNTSNISINNRSSTAGTINQSGTSDVNVNGVVRIGHWSGAIGNYNISGGTLDVLGNPGATVNQGAVAEQVGVIYLGIDGTGNLSVSGTGAVTATALVLDGRGSTAGTDTLTISGGTVTLGNNTNATTIANSGLFAGNFNANTSYAVNLSAGTLRAITGFTTPLNMNLTGVGTANAINIETVSTNLSFTGVLSGAGGLNKVGPGTLRLTNTNTYLSDTTVNGGTLQLQNGNAILNTAGVVTVGLGATLELLSSETVSSLVGVGDAVGSNDGLLALGSNTLTTVSSATIADVTSSAGGGIVAGTAIIDGDDDNNITGLSIYLQAATGIGSADPLETAVGAIQVNNTTSGDVQIANSNGGAALTISDLRTLGFGARNLGGALTITNASPLVVAANTSGAGAVLLAAGDSAATGDDLTVNAGVLVESTGSSVTLNAGDDAFVTGNVTAATTVTVNVDEGNADAGVGGAVTITGVITTPLVGGGAFLTGDVDDDEFNFAPQATTAFDVNGDLPFGTPTGDKLNLDISATTAASLILGGIGAGSWSFTPATLRSVVYTSIEDVNANGQYHLVLDANATSFGNTGIDDYLTLRRSGTDFVLERTGDLNLPNDAVGIVFTGDFATILSFTYLGSDDNDILTISDVGGLVDFAGTVPGVTDNGNLAGTAEFLFDGGAGSDRLVFDLTGASAAQSYAIGTGTAAGLEGEVSSTSSGTTLVSYFQDVELAQRTGVGATPGSLTIIGDANANGFTTAANGALTRTSATGYTPFEFSGNNFSELTINALGGADSLDLESLGTGQTNSPAITLDGGDGNDTIRAQSTSGNTGDLDLIGGTGNDVFELYSTANIVDGLAGPVDVDGTDGNAGGNLDRLVIIDSGDGSGDNVLIEAVDAATSEDYVITGLGPATSNVTFRSIDDLQYTGTAGNDTIDAQFVATTPLHDLNTVILAGFNGADQFLLFTSDQLGGSAPAPVPSVASGLSSITLLGGDGFDTFGETPTGLTDTGAMDVGLVVPDSTRMIRPSLSTAIVINGGPPSVALPTGDTIGDVLNLDISDLPDTLPVVVASGTVNIPGAPLAFAPLTWTDIEDLNLVDDGVLTNVQVGDLFGRMTDANDLVQFSRLNGVNQVRMRVNNWSGVYTVPGKTIVYGRGGIDHITQANLFNPAVFYGEDGNDVLTGASNNDWLVGGAGNDRISGAEGTNVLWGDDAPTSAETEPQDVDGLNDGDDNLSAGLGNDVFYGGGGNDLVNAGGGNDYVHGGWGNDNLAGVAGDDRLYGGQGDDVLSGYLGNDLLSGGAGNDRLYGQTGNDVIIGGDGEDMLVGDTGNDLLITGIVANEHSTWSSLAPTSTFSAATYSDPGDNDTALLNLLLQWGSASNSSLLGSITHDGDDDDVAGYTGADDFCWEAADLLDQPGATNPSDFNAPSMGPDERIGPTY